MGAEEVGDEEPCESADSPSCTSSQDLSLSVIVQIDATDGNPRGTRTQCQGKCRPCHKTGDESMSEQEEEGEVHREEADKLRVG